YAWLANSTQIWEAYASYAVLGGIGSGMIYSSCINIVAKWYPEKKGWRTGFVNGAWAYGAVPWIFAIGAATTGSGVVNMTTAQVKWIAIQYACYIGSSLFGVAYYYVFGTAMGLGFWAIVAGVAGFSLCDGLFRPVYGLISEYIGRRRTMTYAYAGNVIFQFLT